VYLHFPGKGFPQITKEVEDKGRNVRMVNRDHLEELPWVGPTLRSGRGGGRDPRKGGNVS